MPRRGSRRNEPGARSTPSAPSPAVTSSARGGRGGGGHPAPQRPSNVAASSSSSSSASTSLARDLQQRVVLSEREKAPESSAAAETLPERAPASSKASRFPVRPGYGQIGTKCIVNANHFLLTLSSEKRLFHYDVSISPEVTSRVLTRKVISLLVNQYGESHLGNRKPAFDGRKSWYTAGPLPFESKEFPVKLVENEQTVARRKEKDYKVTIKFASQPDIHHLNQFLAGRQLDQPQETIQVLDVVLRQTPTTDYIPVGRSFFSPNLGRRTPIGDGLECWRGFYQSVRPTQMGLSVNIDISATAFFEPLPVVEFVSKFFNIYDHSRPLSDHDRVKVRKALKGVDVFGTHRRNASIKYRISGITNEPLSQLSFPSDDSGNRVSVIQYFKERYNYRLEIINWPCLLAGTSQKPSYLPMEVCVISEGQKYSKKLNDRQITAILRETCQRPRDREGSITAMVRQNNYNADMFAKEFGIKVSDRLTSVEARVLPPPELQYHATGREANCRPRVGQWNMINKKMVNGGIVKYWACLNLSSRRQDQVNIFCNQLIDMCSNIGMTFERNPVLPIVSARPDRLKVALEDIGRQSFAKLAKRDANVKQLQLLIIILPDVSGSYGKIKRICETELGMITQCCSPRNAFNPRGNNKQYCENLALKINVKAGGRNTVLVDALSRRIPLVTDAPTIIFGADVTHPPPGEDSSPSIAAVVASMDWPEVTKYRALLSAQQHRREIIDDLYQQIRDPQKGLLHVGLIRDHLIAFRRATGLKPHRIIFYRDGVSEGQFGQVLFHELDAIRKACHSLEQEYVPPITFVVVQKRHHTRLFPSIHGDPNWTDRSGNILPGTVVDRRICHPTEFDFYLCSHAGIQGTSRPTHYHVLWDENKFSADHLQILTNNLCYTYARCTRSVSIVPPAYYAHLAAFRARYYTESETSDSGSSAGGSSTRERGLVVRPLPKVLENVNQVMFFC